MSSNIEPGAPRGSDRDAAWRSSSVSKSWHEDSRKDPDELEREIDETRAEVQATLNALERKLSPNQLFDQAFGRFRDQGGEFVHNLSDQVRQNPMPVLLTSIGIAWMMMNGRRANGGGAAMRSHTDSDGMHERWEHTKERASGVKQSVAGAGQALRERGSAARDKMQESRAAMSRASHAVGERSKRAASMARDEWAHARSSFDHMLQDQPLMLGAIGLAAGAIIGAVLPATEAEDRRLGPARDRALDRARETGEHGLQRVRERSEQLADQAKERIRGGDGERREDLDAAGERGLAGSAGDTLREGASTAGGSGAGSTTRPAGGVDRPASAAGVSRPGLQSENESRSDQPRDPIGQPASTRTNKTPPL